MSQEGVSDSEIGEALRKLVRDRVAAGSYVVLNGDRSRNYFVQFATQLEIGRFQIQEGNFVHRVPAPLNCRNSS